MNEKKRQHNATMDHGSDDEAKKFKHTSSYSAVTFIQNSLVTHFEDLSNTLIHEIFEYLDTYHIYLAFFNVNTRFQKLFVTLTAPIKINISSLSKSTFQRYYNDFIQLNKHRIQTLYLSNPFAIDLFSSSTENISKCSQLQTLILNDIHSSSLENLLIGLASLSNFSSLSIHIPQDSNKINIYKSVFQLPVLKYCKMTFYENIQLGLLPMSTTKFSPIEHLVITDNYNLNEIDSVLSYVPQLRRLSIQYEHGKKPVVFCMILNSLTHISVKGDRIRFDNIDRFIKKYFRQIKVLQILSSGRSFNSYFVDIWKKTVLKYLPHLQVFDFEDKYRIPCPYIKEIYQSIFNTGDCLWSLHVRQWFFTHEPMSEEYLHKLSISILPHRKSCIRFTTNWSSCKYKCQLKPVVNSVQHVILEQQYALPNYSKPFRNVTELSIPSSSYINSKDFAQISTNKIVCFNQLTKLNINIDFFKFPDLIEMLIYTSNIHTLTFISRFTDECDVLLIKKSETFRLVSMQNKIKNITLKNDCPVKTIELLVNLCPGLQQLTFTTSRQLFQQSVKFLLSEINTTTCQLFSLCISQVNTNSIDTIRNLIESTELQYNYSTTIIDDKLYLWW